LHHYRKPKRFTIWTHLASHVYISGEKKRKKKRKQEKTEDPIVAYICHVVRPTLIELILTQTSGGIAEKEEKKRGEK